MAKNIRMNIKRYLTGLLVVVICAGQAGAQEKQKLQIGDPAPPLKYAKWLQGPRTITEINKNKLYVIEFWATWCGPCIQAMPHLSELAKKYTGKIDFIGCDVWENMYGGPKDQEYYLPKVTRFVQDQYKLGRMTYNVIMDNTAGDMANAWLKAAGIEGIPSTFVISKGRIAWIGHPLYLDSILVAIVAGTYDVQAEKDRQARQAKRNEEMSAGYNAAIKAYKDAEAAKDYDKALGLMDTAIAKFPTSSYMFVTDKFMLLLQQQGEEKAIAYGRELQKEKLAGQVLIANLYAKDSLSKAVNEFGAEAVKEWDMANAKVLDILATFEARAGHYQEAAETQQKAVDKAKTEKDNPGMTDSVISDMQKKADEYQKKADAASNPSNAPEKQAITLDVGDKAPKLRYAKWIKGTPVKAFEKDRIYVVEFWATWCGPCIQQMPHLSKVAKEFKKNVTVIGVNIWEGAHDKDKKPYESYLPKITKFVKGMGDNMAYHVMSDNNAEYMGNTWMKASGQGGIPCTFLIKDGTILWIGHPYIIDSMINLVQTGKYDVVAERKSREEARVAAANGPMNKFEQVISAVEKAKADKQYDRAIRLLDDAIANDSVMAGTLGFFKFQTLLESGNEDTALAFAKQWQATKPGYVGSTGAVIAGTKGLSKETYLYGMELLNTLLSNPMIPPATVYTQIAQVYANMDDYKAAIEMQEKAVKSAKQSLKEGKFPGFIMEDTVKELEATLAEYKKN